MHPSVLAICSLIYKDPRCFGTATCGTYVDTANGVVPWYHRCCVLLDEVLPLVPTRDTAGSVAL